MKVSSSTVQPTLTSGVNLRPETPLHHRFRRPGRFNLTAPTCHLNALRNEKNASINAARAELTKLAKERGNLIQAIKDGVPASEIKDDLARITAQREELEALLDGTAEEPVLLHPNMAGYYRQQMENLTKVLNEDENRAEAADLIRSLVDRITLTPNDQGKLDICLFGDLAGILTMASNKDRPLDQSDPSVQQVKVVAGARKQRESLILPVRL